MALSFHIPIWLIWVTATLMVMADLSLGPKTRAGLTDRAEAWWDDVGRAPFSHLIGDMAARVRLRLGRYLAHTSGPLRFHLTMAAGAALMGGAVLAAVAGAVAPDPIATISQGITYFGGPAMVAGWASLAGLFATAHLVSQSQSLIVCCLLLLAYAAIAAGLWTAAVHAATWFEWQVKSTPTAFGTEWFYAEVYMNYMREAAGWPITVAITTVIAAPAAALLIPVTAVMAGKVTRPLLEPVSLYLLIAFSKTPRGVLSTVVGGGLAFLLTVSTSP